LVQETKGLSCDFEESVLNISGDCPLPLRTGLEVVERAVVNGAEAAVVRIEKGVTIGKAGGKGQMALS